MSTFSTKPWIRRAILGILILVLLTPVFGWASGMVGYAEPLESAAQATGAADESTTLNPGLIPDYAVPGLGSSLGTLVSAVIGTTLTLTIAVGVGRLLEQ